MNNSPQSATKGFTKAFWVSNTVELFERMAYYAVFIVLTIYLSSILGFNDLEASMISGLFLTWNRSKRFIIGTILMVIGAVWTIYSF